MMLEQHVAADTSNGLTQSFLQPTGPGGFVQSFGADVHEENDGQGVLGDGVSSCRPSSVVRVGIKGQS